MTLHKLAALLILASLAACTQSGHAPKLQAGDIATKTLLTSVPFHPQAERDDCGPAALAMMLDWSGVDADPASVAPTVYTPGREGTLQADIIQGGRRFGRLVAPVASFQDLLAELDAGHPVLVLQNLALKRWPVWHYAVAIGYDLDHQTIVLHSGTDEHLEMSFAAFDTTWRLSDRWAVTITRPEQLPKSVDRPTALKAVNGLEQAGMNDQAGRAYAALLDRWQGDFTALMGFGNARFAAGDIDAASKAFRHAVTLHPNAAEAWNNLAVSLGQGGRHDEAVLAAKEAVRLGGAHSPVARQTLAELEAAVK
jgi:hypothetical protein